MARRYDLVDKGGPVVRPFLLENRNKDEVELIEEGSLCLQRFFGARGLNDEVDHKVTDPYRILA